MPCGCFGKKGKPLKDNDDFKLDYHAIPPIQPLRTAGNVGNAPGAPQPGRAADTKNRPEDDPDKATKRRNVVASYYSEDCELLNYKPTGSRPHSEYNGHSDHAPLLNNCEPPPSPPAATSSPAPSSPTSSRSGASCRAELAEKRKEFFRELDLNGQRTPLSSATLPSGSRLTNGHGKRPTSHPSANDVGDVTTRKLFNGQMQINLKSAKLPRGKCQGTMDNDSSIDRSYDSSEPLPSPPPTPPQVRAQISALELKSVSLKRTPKPQEPVQLTQEEIERKEEERIKIDAEDDELFSLIDNQTEITTEELSDLIDIIEQPVEVINSSSADKETPSITITSPDTISNTSENAECNSDELRKIANEMIENSSNSQMTEAVTSALEEVISSVESSSQDPSTFTASSKTEILYSETAPEVELYGTVEAPIARVIDETNNIKNIALSQVIDETSNPDYGKPDFKLDDSVVSEIEQDLPVLNVNLHLNESPPSLQETLQHISPPPLQEEFDDSNIELNSTSNANLFPIEESQDMDLIIENIQAVDQLSDPSAPVQMVQSDAEPTNMSLNILADNAESSFLSQVADAETPSEIEESLGTTPSLLSPDDESITQETTVTSTGPIMTKIVTIKKTHEGNDPDNNEGSSTIITTTNTTETSIPLVFEADSIEKLLENNPDIASQIQNLQSANGVHQITTTTIHKEIDSLTPELQSNVEDINDIPQLININTGDILESMQISSNDVTDVNLTDLQEQLIENAQEVKTKISYENLPEGVKTTTTKIVTTVKDSIPDAEALSQFMLSGNDANTDLITKDGHENDFSTTTTTTTISSFTKDSVDLSPPPSTP